MRKAVFVSVLAALASSSQAVTPPVNQIGDALVGNNGMTLYVFDKDAPGSGKSTCNDECAKNWPPLTATEKDAATGDFSVIVRDDGTKQWAYKGKPLYYWSRDQKPGDQTGDGVNNVWHVAR